MSEENAHGSNGDQALLNGRSEDGISLTSYSQLNGYLPNHRYQPISMDGDAMFGGPFKVDS